MEELKKQNGSQMETIKRYRKVINTELKYKDDRRFNSINSDDMNSEHNKSTHMLRHAVQHQNHITLNDGE